MKSKRLIGGLLTLTVVSSVCLAYNSKGDLSKVFAEKIKQNVVYTANNSNSVTKKVSSKVAVAAAPQAKKTINYEELKPKALETLKKYLGVSPETSKYASTMKYSMRVVDKEKLVQNEQKCIDQIDKGLIKNNTESERERLKSSAVKRYNKLQQEVGSGYVIFSWGTPTSNGTKNGGFDCYTVVYNQGTGEFEGVVFWTDLINYGHPQTASLEQNKGTAEKFITTNNIAGIKNPKFIRSEKNGIYDTDFFYEDAADPSKKAHIIISPDTNKVNGFYINSISDKQVQDGLELG